MESYVVCGSEDETAGCHDIFAGWVGKEPAKPALPTALALPSLSRALGVDYPGHLVRSFDPSL